MQAKAHRREFFRRFAFAFLFVARRFPDRARNADSAIKASKVRFFPKTWINAKSWI
jgi:hypothetical protein